jgi:hypothetical protein
MDEVTIGLALSSWWIVGWVIAGVVIAIAALLLIAAIALARRIEGQAHQITGALDGTRRNTDPLWAVKHVNVNLDRVVRGLAAAREAITR